VTLTGAKIKSVFVSHGRLTIVLRRAVSSLTVQINGILLTESPSLAANTKRAHTLPLTVTVDNTRGRRTVIRVQVSSRRS
jgi:hypothetical protein